MSEKNIKAELKELLALREYYNNHPEEAKKVFYKRYDGVVQIGSKDEKENLKNKN